MQLNEHERHVEKVALRLRQMIMEGEFPPGTRIMEVPLAQKLGVSRTPVRLALAVLERDGLVSSEPRRGFTVCEITVGEIADAFDVRGSLEGLACRSIVERGLSVATRIVLEECLATGERLLSRGKFEESDTQAWNDMNARFHSALVTASGNRPLAKALASNNRLPLVDAGAIAFNSANLTVAFQYMRQAQTEHADILEALVKGQAMRVEALVREHIYKARENLRHALDRVQKNHEAAQVPGLRLVVG